jgi:hypothetical protein
MQLSRAQSKYKMLLRKIAALFPPDDTRFGASIEIVGNQIHR